MASSLQLFFPPAPPSPPPTRQKHATVINCVPNPTNPIPDNTNGSASSSSPADLETRKKLSLLEQAGKGACSSLQRSEPRNFEIGWKRTKGIKHEKPKGWQIANFLEKLEELTGRDYGSKELLGKVAGIVAERAREEAEVLREGGEVEDRMVTELCRILKLMEMDFAMVKAAVKEETVKERVKVAKARCRQAILVALSF